MERMYFYIRTSMCTNTTIIAPYVQTLNEITLKESLSVEYSSCWPKLSGTLKFLIVHNCLELDKPQSQLVCPEFWYFIDMVMLANVDFPSERAPVARSVG